MEPPLLLAEVDDPSKVNKLSNHPNGVNAPVSYAG